MTPTGTSPARRSRRSTIAIAVAGALAIAVHIGLGGVLLANPGWTIAADGVLVIVFGKILLVVLGRHTIRHRRAAHTHVSLSEHEDAETDAPHQ